MSLNELISFEIRAAKKLIDYSCELASSQLKISTDNNFRKGIYRSAMHRDLKHLFYQSLKSVDL